MVLRLTTAHSSKPGSVIMIDGEACTVKANDISKTGKHGASKCRIEAIEIFSGKKKVIAVPGDTRFDVPMIEKRKAQVLSVSENSASIMDLESFETIDVPYGEDIKEQLAAEKQVEYWDIEGKKCIMRVM
ncbi:MAG: translation initiation factor IF-5A [Nanoarchaeota archaeon]